MSNGEPADPYRRIFDANPIPMWVVDGNTRRILNVNRAAIDRFRLTREEFLKRAADELPPSNGVAQPMDFDGRPALLVTCDAAPVWMSVLYEQQVAMAQELHDGLGQELTGLGFLAKSLAEEMKRSPKAAAKASKFAAGLRCAVERVRAISRGLMPVDVDELGLKAALNRLVDSMRDLYGLSARFECPGEVVCDNREAAVQLYHIAQEAATNAAKHAGAKHLLIRLENEGGILSLAVEDDGRGFEARNSHGGSGLRIMRRRAELIGARLAVEPIPGGGTRVRCGR